MKKRIIAVSRLSKLQRIRRRERIIIENTYNFGVDRYSFQEGKAPTFYTLLKTKKNFPLITKFSCQR